MNDKPGRDMIVTVLSSVDGTIEVSSLIDDQNLLETGIIDSAQFLEMVTLLEEQFATEIDFLNVDPSELTTINGLLRVFSGSEP
jgi:acyl carrier protein